MLDYEQHRKHFEEMTIPEPNSGCLLWLGSFDSNGYGRIWHHQKQSHIRASHVSLYFANRPVPKGKIACHHCDNPFCVEPNHLFHGTMKDNTHDMMRKGRMNVSGLEAWRKSKEYSQDQKDEAVRLFKLGVVIPKIGKAIKAEEKTIREWLKPHGYVSVRDRNQTHCSNGHLRTPENTCVTKRDLFLCKICSHERYKAKMAKLGLVAHKRVFMNGR